MTKAFGHDFVTINDVRQEFIDSNKKVWIHLATIQRGFKQYCVFMKPGAKNVYIEEADIKEPGLFKAITDEEEFKDLYLFCLTNGLLMVSGKDKETKWAENTRLI